MLRQFDRFGGRVRPSTGNDRHAAMRGFDAELDHALVFGVRQRRRFAGRTAWNDAVRALRDLPVDETLERLLIDRSIAERRDEGDQRTLEHTSLLRRGLSGPHQGPK